ncbi:MAG: acetyl-CoA carboxylase biotin carboxyl carrier protein [Coleofasciculus sp. Co-bin14]|nr:acetyl-CoA carboxylase biotin carboxyl carrier protein [Coleofasciculus sp. Co-bin14]
MPLDFNQLRELIAAIAQTDIAELTLKSADFELTVRKGLRAMPPADTALGSSIGSIPTSGFVAEQNTASPIPLAPPPTPEVVPRGSAPSPTVPPVVDQKWEEVLSPMVGTFYRSPSPDDPPYVEVGDRIRIGQTVCIIEAMKLMNEIEAEVSGEVVEILVENGKPVEYGQPLMRIKPG